VQRINLNVKADFDDKYFVKGSANHLEQVIVNLILNSLDAILERKEIEPDLVGQIEVNMNRDSGNVFIHIIDNGMGIPIEMQDKIYDPFFTSKKVGKGTGLGLAVSFNLIKEHRGKVSFNTSVGVGTEFVIELPCYSK
jgi:signal transduction histidine kinase